MIISEQPSLNPNLISQRPAAQIKTLPEDWQVVEVLDEEFSDDGEHAYLFVQKRCLSTAPVAQWLAEQIGVPEMDVGYAGMKDKHALTQQWYSVRIPSAQSDMNLAALTHDEGDEQIKVMACHRHQRKLRRGDHLANRFRIVLRNVGDGIDPDVLIEGLKGGFPNYFGPQRFGRHNLGDALYWLEHRRDPKVSRRLSRQQKGWHLSVLRSWIFNQLLVQRVQDKSWQRCLDGDLTVTGSHGELEPMGPLWGRGRDPLDAEALRRQQFSFKQIQTPDGKQSLGEVCAALEHAGVDRGQRALGVRPWDVSCEQDLGEATLALSFCLPVGAYATVMLGQWFDLQDQSSVTSS